METRGQFRARELTALVISPDRQIAAAFSKTLPETRAFQIFADLAAYPTNQQLEVKLRQLKPDLLLIDVATDLDAAVELVRFLEQFRPVVRAIGLHHSNNSDAVLRTLRAGASEFLHAPFDVQIQRDAISRLRKLLAPEPATEQELGKVIVFSSVKPGSGASTLATQTAFALRRGTGMRVLLADFDLMGGTIGFYLKVPSGYSLVDAVEHSERMDPALWTAMTVNTGGIDVLPAPELPHTQSIDQTRLHDVIEYTRLMYDWVILDLPAIFQRISLLALSDSDMTFLISTSELPSLHLARKALQFLSQWGIDKHRYQVVVNRVDRRDGINGSDLEKLFNCPVDASFPNDYFSLHRVVTLGQPLGLDCDLGKAIEGLAGRLAGVSQGEKRRSGSVIEAKPALSQT